MLKMERRRFFSNFIRQLREVTRYQRRINVENSLTGNSYSYSTDIKYKPKAKQKSSHMRNQLYVPEKCKPTAEVLFGIHPILTALQCNKRSKFHKLYIKKEVWDIGDEEEIKHDNLEQIKQLAIQKHIPIVEVSPSVLTALVGDKPHQGVCLDAARFPVKRFHLVEENIIDTWSREKEISNLRYPIWLLTYKVLDPMNLGGILRSAYFLGVNEIIVPSLNSCRMTPVVSKASSGAMEKLSIHSLPREESNFLSFIKLWKRCGGTVIGTVSNKVVISQNVTNYKMDAPVLLIVGNEGFGIDDKILDNCDTLFTINPGRNSDESVTSLNVSVATGILLHHLMINNTK